MPGHSICLASKRSHALSYDSHLDRSGRNPSTNRVRWSNDHSCSLGYTIDWPRGMCWICYGFPGVRSSRCRFHRCRCWFPQHRYAGVAKIYTHTHIYTHSHAQEFAPERKNDIRPPFIYITNDCCDSISRPRRIKQRETSRFFVLACVSSRVYLTYSYVHNRKGSRYTMSVLRPYK